MSEPGYDMLDAILRHSAGFADAAAANLGARVEHCPEWTVADLVWHLTDVHWFWGTIVEDRLDAPPDELRRPSRPSDDQLVEGCRAGARRMAQILGTADPSAHVWTWAPGRENVAFVTRHQVQEAAVHHWDARNAAGEPLEIEPVVAADAIDEFLAVSLSSDVDPADPPPPALAGSFVLRCTDEDAAWTVTDGSSPGTAAIRRGATDGLPELAASASDLLLWLYNRVPLEPGEVPEELISRFQALRFG